MKKAILTLVWSIISLYLSGLLVGLIVSLLPFINPNLPLWQAIISVLVYLFAVVFAIVIPTRLFKSQKVNRVCLGLSGWPTWLDILLGIAGLIIATLLTYLLNQLFLNFPWYQAIADQAQDVGFSNIGTSADRVLAFIALVIISPIAEEIFFRGWIYGKIRQAIPVVPAIIVLSAIFAVMHGQWNAALATFSLSVVFCVQRELTGTIYAGIVLHIINNALAFYSMFIA